MRKNGRYSEQKPSWGFQSSIQLTLQKQNATGFFKKHIHFKIHPPTFGKGINAFDQEEMLQNSYLFSG